MRRRTGKQVQNNDEDDAENEKSSVVDPCSSSTFVVPQPQDFSITTCGSVPQEWMLALFRVLWTQALYYCKRIWLDAGYLTTNFMLLFATAPVLDENTRAQLSEFKKQSSLPYDAKNPDHEALLLDLWHHAFPDTLLEDRVTKQWEELGFQGTDPATDFRGGGIHALQNILYLANNYPILFKRLVEGLHHEEAYPFAITSINITDMLFDILGCGFKKTTLSPAARTFSRLLFSATEHKNLDNHNSDGDDDTAHLLVEMEHNSYTKTVFHEVYCVAFCIFDQEWQKMKAKYMDFPVCLAVTKQQMEKMLQKDFATSLENVKAWNEEQNT